MPAAAARPAGSDPWSPGRATVARLAATRSWRRFAADASGDDWVRLADRLEDPAGMDGWYDAELTGTARGHRDLAGSLIAYRFAGSVAELTMVPLLAARRALVLSPEALRLCFADGARIDAVSLDHPTVAVLAGDPDAGRPGTVVADDEGLRHTAASGLADVFVGLVTAVRKRAPFGVRGMWGTLADHVADVALRWARDTSGDAERAWSEAAAVTELLAGHPAARLGSRPRRHRVTCPAGTGLFMTRGTCCLIYKAHEPGPGEPDGGHTRIDAAACTSCPLRTAEDRQERLVRFLTERSGAV